MEKGDYPILLTGALVGFMLGCMWMKLNSIEKQVAQNPYGKHITTSYDPEGRLIDYLEMPVKSDLGVGASYNGLRNFTQTESRGIEG